MNLPLALPRPVSSAGFTPETRRLLARLPGERGLWVLLGQTHAADEPSARSAISPYPNGGHPEASGQAARLAHYFLLGALLRGEQALFLDAANGFNPHRLTEMTRRMGREPEDLLARVRLSRAFTCFQLAELVERVPAAARRWGARCVFVTGLPEIFDDEELQEDEARRVFGRALEGMRRWHGLRLSTLVFTSAFTPLRTLRRWLGAQLERAADGVFRFEETPQGLAVRLPARPPILVGQAFLPVHHGRKPVA